MNDEMLYELKCNSKIYVEFDKIYLYKFNKSNKKFDTNKLYNCKIKLFYFYSTYVELFISIDVNNDNSFSFNHKIRQSSIIKLNNIQIDDIKTTQYKMNFDLYEKHFITLFDDVTKYIELTK